MSRDLARGNVSGGSNSKFIKFLLYSIWKLIMKIFTCLTAQKFLAPSYWTCTERLLTIPRQPNMKLICVLETRWKLWRRTRMVRRFQPAILTHESKWELFNVCCSGWWFCQCDSKRGWVPASYLEPLDGPEESEEAEPDYGGKLLSLLALFNQWICISVVWSVSIGELYITIKAYKAEQEDEITLELGESIEVIHKLLDGWWVIR